MPSCKEIQRVNTKIVIWMSLFPHDRHWNKGFERYKDTKASFQSNFYYASFDPASKTVVSKGRFIELYAFQVGQLHLGRKERRGKEQRQRTEKFNLIDSDPFKQLTFVLLVEPVELIACWGARIINVQLGDVFLKCKVKAPYFQTLRSH